MANDPREHAKKFPIEPHHEIREVFADQLGLLLFDNQGLRIEFAVARMEEPKPPAMPTGKRHVVSRVVLSVPCAIDLINQLEKFAVQLTASGALKMDAGKGDPPKTSH